MENFDPLLIRNINALKNLKENNKALILDDIDWSNISREEKIHLIDKNQISQIRVLYNVINQHPDIIKVVTSNSVSDLLSFFDQNSAISRRLKHIDLKRPMFIVQNTLQQNNITITLVSEKPKLN